MKTPLIITTSIASLAFSASAFGALTLKESGIVVKPGIEINKTEAAPHLDSQTPDVSANSDTVIDGSVALQSPEIKASAQSQGQLPDSEAYPTKHDGENASAGNSGQSATLITQSSSIKTERTSISTETHSLSDGSPEAFAADNYQGQDLYHNNMRVATVRGVATAPGSAHTYVIVSNDQNPDFNDHAWAVNTDTIAWDETNQRLFVLTGSDFNEPNADIEFQGERYETQSSDSWLDFLTNSDHAPAVCLAPLHDWPSAAASCQEGRQAPF